jgi:hypothetical protein
MTISALIQPFFSTENPVLPDPVLVQIGLHIAWATVLGAGALWAGGRLRPAYRVGLCLLMALWALMPGSASPTYWLGLAFQSPSLLTVVLCWGWFFSKPWLKPQTGDNRSKAQEMTLKTGLAIGFVLGWVLLLDTLAWWPVSVYSWGFSAAAGAVVTGLTAVIWALAAGVAQHNVRHSFSFLGILGVMGLFVMTRLPTGNVWDALMDPWLWLALQALVVRACWVRWRARPTA